MTISTVTSHDESLRTGTTSSPESRPSVVFFKEFDAARPRPLPDTVSLEALMESFASDVELQDALTDARKSLSAEVYGDEVSLSALRTKAGLSQSQLAERMGIRQPYIARIEGGVTDPGTDSIARLAEALGVDEATAFAAVRFQRKTRGKNDC